MFDEWQEMPFVAGNQIVGSIIHRTLQDAVIGLIPLDHRREPSGLDNGRGPAQHSEGLGSMVRTPSELSDQNPPDFLKDERGYIEIEPSSECQLKHTALVSGEVQT